jgi:hypothetical protein
MTERDDIIEQLLKSIEEMVNIIEEQESTDPDFGLVREIAEQLRDEIDALQE